MKTNEIAYASSNLYTSKDFPAYNPDSIIGTKGPQIYARMMLDDQVKSLLRFKQFAIVGRDWYFENTAEEGTPEYERNEEISDFFHRMIEDLTGEFSSKLVGILSALENGFSISEKIYTALDGKWIISNIKLRPFETFTFNIDPYGNIQSIEQNGNDEKIPIDKIIHFVYQPDFDECYGQSDLRAAYRAYWSKDVIIKFQNIHLERHASGFPYIITKSKPGDSLMAKLKNMLRNLSTRNAMILPGQYIEKFENFNPARTDAYEKAVSQYDKAIAKALLVPNLLGLSEQGATGSYSQSQTQFDIFTMVIEYIGRTLEDTLNEQMFRQVVDWNFGPGSFPRFKLNFESPTKKTELAKAWAELLSKGAITKTDADEAWLRVMMGAPDVDLEEVMEDPDLGGDQDSGAGGNRGATGPNTEDYQKREPIKVINYERLKKMFDTREQEAITSLNNACAPVLPSMIEQVVKIVGNKALKAIDPARIDNIAVKKSQVNNINKTIRVSLNATMEIAGKEAKAELPKSFAISPRLIGIGMDKGQLEKILSSMSMRATNDLTKTVQNAVRQEVINGIRYNKTLKDTIQAIESNTDIVSTLPKTDSAGRTVNIPSRLENIARTNTAVAINEARNNVFSDPDLKGFVVAYQYSAIMDDRVTDICASLDGRIQKDWGAYTPPNHFQCRSILIPVTEVDDWDGKEDRIPSSVNPAKGFS